MPPVMTTSISPSAATARKLISGSTPPDEIPESVSGAMICATTTSTAAAIQTGTNPAPIMALLTSEASRRCLHDPPASIPGAYAWPQRITPGLGWRRRCYGGKRPE